MNRSELVTILLSAPAWARHCLSVNDDALRMKAADEIATILLDALAADADPQGAAGEMEIVPAVCARIATPSETHLA